MGGHGRGRSGRVRGEDTYTHIHVLSEDKYNVQRMYPPPPPPPTHTHTHTHIHILVIYASAVDVLEP